MDLNLKLFDLDVLPKCSIIPYLYQFNQLFYQNTNTITSICSNQLIYIGVHIIKPIEYKGSTKEFIDNVLKHFDYIDFNYSIIYDTNEVLQETTSSMLSNSLNSLQQTNEKSSINKKKFEITSIGILIYIETILKISKQLYNLPLLLKINLQIPMKYIQSMNQRFMMDHNETNIRLLMDLNRFKSIYNILVNSM